MSARLLCGDVLDRLKALPDGSARCCVTSPPYWGLRDYGKDGQIGLEPTPDLFVARLVGVFREVRRVLTDDGTLWLNLPWRKGMAPDGPRYRALGNSMAVPVMHYIGKRIQLVEEADA